MIRTLIALAATISTSFACAYDQYEAGRVAGMYLAASDVLIKLKSSECGYVIQKPVPTMDERKKEVLSYMTARDRVEFQAFWSSSEYKAKLADDQKLVDSTIQMALSKNDKKTACGLAVGALAPAIKAGNEAWKAFIKRNNLMPK